MLSAVESRRLLELEKREKIQNAKTDLLAFTKHTFQKYQVNWHHRYIANELNEFVFGSTDRLIICTPPRMGKTELVSRRLPAFIFGNLPDAQIIATSYSADLSSRNNRDVQRIIDNPLFSEIFPEIKLFGKNVRSVAGGTYLRNSEIFEIVDHRGVYRSAGVGGGITGMGMHFGIVDDPIKSYKEAQSITIRNAIWNWYHTDFESRLEENGKIAVIMTRWHEDDLVGRLLLQAKNDPEAPQWKVVVFPNILETPNNYDPRQIGDVLWPEKFPLKRVKQIKASWGSYKFNALHQQNPTPPEGTIIKRHWVKFYKLSETPPRFDEVIISGDFAEGSESGDFTVLQVWGKLGANKYLLDQVRDKLDTPQSIDALNDLWAKWPNAYVKLLEKKSTGVAVIQMVQTKIPGIIAVNPTDSKDFRLKAVSPDFEAGNVYFPNMVECPWVSDVIEEICGFPSTPNDDTVDTTTQALLRWQAGHSDEFGEDLVQETSTIVHDLGHGGEW